jgi:hypothetical protein
LVQYFLDKYSIEKKGMVLDPFVGTGTTLVESKLKGFGSIGIEANPVIRFITNTKLNWLPRPQELRDQANEISGNVDRIFKSQGIDDNNLMCTGHPDLLDLPDSSKKLLLANSISPIPMHKALTLLAQIRTAAPHLKDHLLVGFLKTVIKDLSNLRFGPEIGVGKIRQDAHILAPWLANIEVMSADLDSIENQVFPESTILLGDSREPQKLLQTKSIGAVITSPPYPNEKDYSRTTRLESVLLGIISTKEELRNVKKTFVRSNTRSIYKEDTDDRYVLNLKSVLNLAKKIEERRIELKKTSGFEKMYSKVTVQYFGGMARHLAELRDSLQPGAFLVYVVGDQASYLQVLIKTGQILAEIAESLGYEVVDIELFRTRFATVSRAELREEAVILRWNGK